MIVTSRTICALSVTYGDRSCLVEKMIERTLAEGVDYIVVVDNGSSSVSAAELGRLSDIHGDRVDVLRSEENLGSAGGYSMGLEYVLERADAEFVWFLDGREESRDAAWGDERALRDSWRRAKWDIAQR